VLRPHQPSPPVGPREGCSAAGRPDTSFPTRPVPPALGLLPLTFPAIGSPGFGLRQKPGCTPNLPNIFQALGKISAPRGSVCVMRTRVKHPGVFTTVRTWFRTLLKSHGPWPQPSAPPLPGRGFCCSHQGQTAARSHRQGQCKPNCKPAAAGGGGAPQSAPTRLG